MFPEDDRMIETCRSVCFNVKFILLKIIYVHLLVCYLKKRKKRFKKWPEKGRDNQTK